MSTQTGPCIKGREDAEIIRAFANEMKVMLPSAYTGGTCSVLFAELNPDLPPKRLAETAEALRASSASLSSFPLRSSS